MYDRECIQFFSSLEVPHPVRDIGESKNEDGNVQTENRPKRKGTSNGKGPQTEKGPQRLLIFKEAIRCSWLIRHCGFSAPQSCMVDLMNLLVCNCTVMYLILRSHNLRPQLCVRNGYLSVDNPTCLYVCLSSLVYGLQPGYKYMNSGVATSCEYSRSYACSMQAKSGVTIVHTV